MGVAVSLIIIAVGLILALAVHPSGSPSVDPNTVGWILFIVGLVGLLLDVILWESWGPGYLRRRTAYVDRGYAVRPRRRTVVDEVEEGPGPPGPPLH
jgi:Domain of unknown function (DUF6458)